jgi:hypothetical protein
MPETSQSNSVAQVASQVVKTTQGRLFSVIGYNAKASAQFIQVHNAAALPSEAAVPIISFTVAASSNFSWVSPNPDGTNFSDGIVVCNSSTQPTKTIGTTDTWFNVEYV